MFLIRALALNCFTAILMGCCVTAFAVPAAAHATTYYVRMDGGTSLQCTGRVDAAYPKRGHYHACAWNSPMEALPPTLPNYPHAARIKGGDTLVIGPGVYRIGWTKDEYDSAHMGDACAPKYTPACTLQAIPSGEQAQPTRIVGAGWDTGCSAPPELYGADGVNHVLNLMGSSNVVVACLNLTDHEECTLNYRPDPAKACNHEWASTDPPAYGDWAARGIYAADSNNVTLQDLDIHGFADMGVQAGRISNWTVTRVTVAGNGNVGWNGDLGGNDHSSSNSGKLIFTDLTVEWNGCQEGYPPRGNYRMCYGQEQGGYGDGLGAAWTGGDWIFIRPKFVRNIQDGLDLLYLNGAGSVTVDHGYFARNVGNDLKTSGNAAITNSVFIAQCSAFKDSGMPIAPTPCRAGGGEFANFTGPGQTVLFSHNTLVGESGCLFGGDPTYNNTSVPVVASDVYVIDNNIFIGKSKWNGDGQTCLFYDGELGNRPATVKWSNDLVWQVRNSLVICAKAGIVCRNPILTNESLGNFDPKPRLGSPALGTATDKSSIGAIQTLRIP